MFLVVSSVVSFVYVGLEIGVEYNAIPKLNNLY